MKVRPWPIVILAAYQLLSPFLDWGISAYLQNTSPLEWFKSFHSTWDAILFFALPWFSAIAIFAVRAWSYPVFILVTLRNMIETYQAHVQSPEQLPLQYLLVLYTVNIAMVSYLLLPSMRAAYFDPKLRWWEAKPRYTVDFSADLEREFNKQDCIITNISDGGCFLVTQEPLRVNETITLHFAFHFLSLHIRGKVLHQGQSLFAGYGIQFIDMDPLCKSQIRDLTQALKLSGFTPRYEKPSLSADFMNWVSDLKNGRGFVPKLPNYSQDQSRYLDHEEMVTTPESRTHKKKAA